MTDQRPDAIALHLARTALMEAIEFLTWDGPFVMWKDRNIDAVLDAVQHRGDAAKEDSDD